jgi:hypothetical protein
MAQLVQNTVLGATCAGRCSAMRVGRTPYSEPAKAPLEGALDAINPFAPTMGMLIIKALVVDILAAGSNAKPRPDRFCALDIC